MFFVSVAIPTYGCRTLRDFRRVRGNNLGIVMLGLFKPTALALNGDSPRHTNGAKDVAEAPGNMGTDGTFSHSGTYIKREDNVPSGSCEEISQKRLDIVIAETMDARTLHM